MSSSNFSSRTNTLKKIIKRLPAQLTYYGSALGAIVLAGGGQLPPGLEFVAGGIGANLLSNLVDEIARGEDMLDDEIRQRAEDAITQSDIANLLTKQDFLQGYARLIQRLDAQKAMSQDILDELRTGFQAAATSEQVEELKQLLLQLVQQSPSGSAARTRIFISYARADDEPFVERLYHDLKDEFEVWWDRVSMPNRGLTFLQEIRDAIDHADRLLLVAGPRAFTSDYVRDEWQYAYDTYKGINIALRLGDYPDLPEQLGGFDAPDFRSDDDYAERFATLKRQLAEPVAPVGEFHGVPALPPHFLNRLEALDALRDLVIADVDKPTLISAEKRTTAVEGMGGIGKSVIATAFAHDRKVRFAFPDGIVWLTAGNKPSMYEMYRAVGVALGDDLHNYPDETTARQNAQKALADKKCLLILDDVWELPVGRAFRDLISGTSARLLITTRNLQINDVLNANEYRLKLIDESQASDYLRSWVGDDPDLETIAEKLGYLFLALKLAGARMKKDGLSGVDYLRTFDRVSRMKIDRQASDREDSLEASITLSVDAAFASAEDEKLLYHTFGIFPEDTPVPQQTVLQLWRHLRPDVDEFNLLETLNALVDLALVERDTESLTLHDLLHSYTKEKLGDLYQETHQVLLTVYRASDLEWHEINDDGYILHHLIFHLLEGNHYSELEYIGYLVNKYRQFATQIRVTTNLSTYYSQHSSHVDSLLMNWLKKSNQNTYTAYIAAYVSILNELEKHLKVILLHSDTNPKNVVVREAYLLWNRNPNLMIGLLDDLADKISLFRPIRSIRHLDTMMRLSTSILFEDYTRHGASAQSIPLLRGVWIKVLKKLLVVSNIRLVEKIVRPIRILVRRIAIRIALILLRRVYEADISPTTLDDLASLLPISYQTQTAIRDVLPHLDAGAGVRRSKPEELVEVAYNLDLDGDYNPLLVNLAHYAMLSHFIADPVTATNAIYELTRRIADRCAKTHDPLAPTVSVWFHFMSIAIDSITLMELDAESFAAILPVYKEIVDLKVSKFHSSYRNYRGRVFRFPVTSDAVYLYGVGETEASIELLNKAIEPYIASKDHDFIIYSVVTISNYSRFWNMPSAFVQCMYQVLRQLGAYLAELKSNDPVIFQRFWDEITGSIETYWAFHQQVVEEFVKVCDNQGQILPDQERQRLLSAAADPADDFAERLSQVGILAMNRGMRAKHPFVRDEVFKHIYLQAIDSKNITDLAQRVSSHFINTVYGDTII